MNLIAITVILISSSFWFLQSPSKYSRRNRYSGLWECYYGNHVVGGGVEEGEGGDVGDREEEEGGLKNIRGFLLKRRKSPLKGWHKVRDDIETGITVMDYIVPL